MNRFLLAELVTMVDVTQAYVDQCLADHVEGRLDPVATAKAKWSSADVQNRVIDACVQLCAGSNEIMKELIGRSLGLGAPRG